MTSISEVEVRELAESAAKNLHSLPTGERQITQAARATLSTRGFAQTILSLLDRLEAVEGALKIIDAMNPEEWGEQGIWKAQQVAHAALSASPSVNQSTQGKEDSHE